MSHELVYLLLICALMTVPRALQRFRLPAPLTCMLLGLALVLAWKSAPRHNDAVHLLATLGISTLFLFAGLEVNPTQLRLGWRHLRAYLSARLLMLLLVGWLAWWLLGLNWQAAALLALALLTSSTGFIVDSLDRFLAHPQDRFWATNKAICGELLALALMFVILQADEPQRLAGAVVVLLLMMTAIPVLYLVLSRWISPQAPESEFSILVTVGFAAAYVTNKLGVEYLLGAFVAGATARVLRPRLPALASEHNLHAIKLFASFFMPFYFFSNGARVPMGALTIEALAMGLVLIIVLVPARLGWAWFLRRQLSGEGAESSTRVDVLLMPTLIFTLVLAAILHERFGISDVLYGGLMLYAFLNTLLPSLVLRPLLIKKPSSPLGARQD